MITFPLYLYNTLNTPITIQDISLEMLANDFFEISSASQLSRVAWTNSDLETLIKQGRVILTRSAEVSPPTSEESYSSTEAVRVFHGIASASNVEYIDSAGLGAADVQSALDVLAERTLGHEQPFIELSEIDITHGLGKLPSVRVVDDAGVEFEAEVDHIDKSSLIVRLNKAMSGTVYCA